VAKTQSRRTMDVLVLVAAAAAAVPPLKRIALIARDKLDRKNARRKLARAEAHALQALVGAGGGRVDEDEEMEEEEETAAAKEAQRKATGALYQRECRKRKSEAQNTAAREEAARTTASTLVPTTTPTGSSENKILSEKTYSRNWKKFTTGNTFLGDSHVVGYLKQALKQPIYQQGLVTHGWTGPRDSAVMKAGVGKIKEAMQKTSRKGGGKVHTNGRDVRAFRNGVGTALSGSGSRRQLEKVYALPHNAAAQANARRAGLNAAQDGTACSVCPPLAMVQRKRRCNGITDEMKSTVAYWAKFDEASTVSPVPGDCRQEQDSDGTWHLVACHYAVDTVDKLHTKFLTYLSGLAPPIAGQDPPRGRAPGVSAFTKILAKLPWFKTTTPGGHREVCCCPYHTGIRVIFSAFQQNLEANCQCRGGVMNQGGCKTALVFELGDLCEAVQCPKGDAPRTKLCCAEHRCPNENCGVKAGLPFCPTAESANVRVSWLEWSKERLAKTKGGFRNVTLLVRRTGTGEEMGKAIRKQLEVFMEHEWKTTWTKEECKELGVPLEVGGRTMSIYGKGAGSGKSERSEKYVVTFSFL